MTSDPLLRALLALETAVRRQADKHRAPEESDSGVAEPLRTALRRLDVVRAKTGSAPGRLRRA